MMMRRAVAVAMFAVLVSTVVPASGGTIVEQSVKTGPRDQWGPSAEGDEWFGWSEFARPLFRAVAQPMVAGELTDPVQVLRKRSNAHTFFGDFDPASDEAIFQDNGARSVNANVYLADLTNPGTYSGPGSGINTEYWEWSPEISADWILFGRNRFDRGSSPWKVILYERATGDTTVLDKVENRCGCIFPQDVNERYATWVKCVARCNVFVYDTQDQTTTKIYNPDKYQYAASVSEEGRVYFVRSGRGCGANVQIRAIDLAAKDPTSSLPVYSYPAGMELASSIHMVDGVDGVHDLYFDRADCNADRFQGNIYRILGVFSETTMTSVVADPSGGSGLAGGASRFLERPDARPIG
jgi:hypothetical protein